MKRTLVAILTVVFGMALALSGVSAPAQAAKSKTWCDPHSGTSGGSCITVSSPKFHEIVMDTVPVRNKSKKVTVHASCKWTDTLTVGLEAGYSATASAKAEIFKLASAEVSVTLSLKLSMTASTAREVAGDFYLKPGQQVMCHRTFGYYSYTTTVYQYWTSGSSTKKYTTRVPFSLGALFADR